MQRRQVDRPRSLELPPVRDSCGIPRSHSLLTRAAARRSLPLPAVVITNGAFTDRRKTSHIAYSSFYLSLYSVLRNVLARDPDVHAGFSPLPHGLRHGARAAERPVD